MLGRTPENIVAIRPMKDGVTSTSKSRRRCCTSSRRCIIAADRARVVVAVPSGITEVEKRAVEIRPPTPEPARYT